MASRGMSIVYELGDAATKETLVQALVGTLSGTAKRKRAVKVTGESEVFQEGALGEAPGGGGMSTYKELCSIANEMGQPDLIYRFMDLARHQVRAKQRGTLLSPLGLARTRRRANLEGYETDNKGRVAILGDNTTLIGDVCVRSLAVM